ncbi:mechanosensitive ion channel family protein [Azospirillum melinis]|uniref:mechanosensitive ion channel family protein n=1 Tax=Azospirillum melinis TaxID=328839 RepID=UPI003757008A
MSSPVSHGTLAGALLGVALLLSAIPGAIPASAQASPPQEPVPPQVRQFLQSLREDPAVRTWVERQLKGPATPQTQTEETTSSEMMTMSIGGLREHLLQLAAAVPRLPAEIRTGVARLRDELHGRHLLGVLVAAFLALGRGAEWLFCKATRSYWRHVRSMPTASMAERLRLIAFRLAFRLSEVATFAIGSIGAFLAFDWPPLLREVAITYLIAAVGLRLVLLTSRVLLAPQFENLPDVERFRLVPMTTGAARYWYRRLTLFAGLFAFGWATVSTLRTLGLPPEAREVVVYALGLGLLALALEVVWTRPQPAPAMMPEEHTLRHVSHALGANALSVYLVLLWAFWVAGLTGLLWLGIVAVVLPMAIKGTERTIHHALRPQEGTGAAEGPHLGAVYLDRGVRSLLIAGAAFVLAHAWHIDIAEMASHDTLLTRLVRGALTSVVILLVADLLWQVVKALIDRRLVESRMLAPPSSEEALRQARLRTLLPLFRSTIFIVLAAAAVLMALSSLGVEIGPLIAGAGVVGVAVGFGSQTLVRDVISGIFHLLDDAFRVGEYIQSGSYKGTVESLGIRSLKLRHHRGPIFTVPYGQLGAVKNESRDWVIDKMTLGVTYDSDLDLAKRLIKQVGKELAADPEFAPSIIEPLKMQGVDQFGDFAIQLRLKMKTQPGEQFAIRRKAYVLIKKAFDANGIQFALPTVQVAGREESTPAVAQAALKLVNPSSSE